MSVESWSLIVCCIVGLIAAIVPVTTKKMFYAQSVVLTSLASFATLTAGIEPNANVYHSVFALAITVAISFIMFYQLSVVHRRSITRNRQKAAVAVQYMNDIFFGAHDAVQLSTRRNDITEWSLSLAKQICPPEEEWIIEFIEENFKLIGHVVDSSVELMPRNFMLNQPPVPEGIEIVRHAISRKDVSTYLERFDRMFDGWVTIEE